MFGRATITLCIGPHSSSLNSDKTRRGFSVTAKHQIVYTNLLGTLGLDKRGLLRYYVSYSKAPRDSLYLFNQV